VSESGKPRYEAEGIEVFYMLELTRTTPAARAAGAARRPPPPFVFANKRARVVHHPRGVVGVIGPWNWPMLNNYADCIAPLVCGNAVVLKPRSTRRDVAARRRAGRSWAARRRLPGRAGRGEAARRWSSAPT
jgi:acyl-CoA reductase-like NAD-dependent aldehyde dehydrogenase